jgi:hypothetical protein
MSNAVSSAHILGGNHRGDRVDKDFYPTSPECTTSFLAMEYEYLKDKKILEPACGDGAISKILIEAGLNVVSTDLIYRGYGVGDVDFLWTMETDCNAIVTNPPFNISVEFIVHALEVLKVDYMAMLLKSQYWHSKNRLPIFEKHPPAVVYPMTWRPDFLKKGAPTMDFQWTVFRPHEGGTLYCPLKKVL